MTSGDGFTYPGPRRPRRSRPVWLGVLIGVLGGNLLAGGIYLASRSDGRTTDVPASDPAADVGDESRRLRLKGVEAMEREDYTAAVDAFVAALKAERPAADVPQLLALARELLDRSEREAAAAAEPKAAPPPRAVAPSPAPKRTASTRRTVDAPSKSPTKISGPTRSRKVAAKAPTPKAQLSAEEVEPEVTSPPPSEKKGGSDELPLCPVDYVPPTPSSPYALIPAKCRPRD